MAAQPIALFRIGSQSDRRKPREFFEIQEQVEQPSISPKLDLILIDMQQRKPWQTAGKSGCSIEEENSFLESVAAPYGKNASIVISEIDALKAGVEGEEIPTDFAYQNARSIVESAYGQVRAKNTVPYTIPNPFVTTDEAGGIRVVWRCRDKHVRVNFGAIAELRSYLYFESRLEHAVEQLNAEHLARRIAWLTEPV